MLNKKNIIFILLISISTIFMGIGYAAVNNITLELSGSSNAKKIDNIKITNVEYYSDNKAIKNESKIINYSATTINSKIVLGSDVLSTISYEVTLKNDTENTFKYIKAIHDDNIEFYDNNNITYNVEGISEGEIMLPDAEKKIILTFKYSTTDTQNSTLNSYINIKFNKIFKIKYAGIEGNNLIDSIEEGKAESINFTNAPVDVEIDGKADYNYNNGILTLSNVSSDLTITGKNGTPFYTITPSNLSIGSTINPNNYSLNETEVTSPYLKYTVDSNNKVVKIESCKKETNNAPSVCLIAAGSNVYNTNKEIITSYFGGTSTNLPSECTEELNQGVTELTCANSYVVLAIDNEDGLFINDIESQKNCVIQPAFGIFSCK